MKTSVRVMVGTLAPVALLPTGAAAQDGVTRYVRYSYEGRTAYGVLDGDTIHERSAAPFSSVDRTGRTVAFSSVRLLAPTEPSKVIAAGLNYQSHLGTRQASDNPGLFAKYPTSIVASGDNIVIPRDAENVHYEGELVVVIGKRAHNVSAADAAEYIFGVTAGNDVSERDWQQADLQWLRAKASDTFGPLGPVVTAGLNHNDLLVQTRLNGEVRQSESSKHLIFDIEEFVSYVSRYVTLMPGDVVEIEVEGVGVLRNTVVAGR